MSTVKETPMMLEHSTMRFHPDWSEVCNPGRHPSESDPSTRGPTGHFRAGPMREGDT